MANQFFNFSPESFEQFARTVALSVFGPGVTVFGNGPDGGREAVFRGEVPYPYPPATQWSGYGVIQAKCKEKTEGTDKDQTWALAQLRAELKAFVESPKRSPNPKYYVFVTNVELSSASGGGRDQADKLVRSYYRKIHLAGHTIWDANQLDGFLAKYDELRRRFTPYLVAGDVLAALLADIERRRPNATHVLSTFLEKELRADEASRLDQAGNRTEEQLRLAQLFFDLPASPEPQLEAPAEQPDADGRLPRGVLYELIQSGSRKLDPRSVHEQETGLQQDPTELFATRFVLLGGPGSGKSTVGQFLAQIHRAAILARRPPYLLDPVSLQIIKETQELCARDLLPWPATPRYPFKIELNRFAKALASTDGDRVETLERYILNALKREHEMTHADLLDWLSAYPSLLILDGLDEVPPTSNRRAVVDAINSFLAELRQVEGDIFVIVTSRQQGYHGELVSGVVAFRHVLPLSSLRALRYVERYAVARFGRSNPEKAADVVAKLRESAGRELTSQLMTSPLQVTFMATVVAARGDPGEDRWQLFASYYRTIYDRERQKAVPPYDSVLTKQQPTIDRLHHDVGFLLQYRGETEGAKAVSLPMDQFRRLLDAYLTELGREGTVKDELVKLITEAASNRLVFLTSKVAGELSFDVRSLQEYMAAECLMTGDPEVVRARLRAIAPITYWRNVFLFAASKCFVDTQSRHLQDAIRLLCEDLNSPSDALLEAVRAGSELAADIMQSGAVAENPNHARHLARIALALVSERYLVGHEAQGVPIDQKLASTYNEALRTVYRPEVGLRIGQADLSKTFGGWALLTRLIRAGVDWAVELGDQSWPTDPEAQIKLILNSTEDLLEDPWMAKRLEQAIWKVPPPTANELRWRRVMSGALRRSDYPGAHYFGIGELVARLKIGAELIDGMSISVKPAFPSSEQHTNPFSESISQQCHTAWLPLVLARRFLASPTAKILGNVLDEIADRAWDTRDLWQLYELPWPLANCLGAVGDIDSLRNIARQIREGAFGDGADWEAAEREWEAHGIDIGTILDVPSKGLSLDGRGHLALPRTLGGSIAHRPYPGSVRSALL